MLPLSSALLIASLAVAAGIFLLNFLFPSSNRS